MTKTTALFCALVVLFFSVSTVFAANELTGKQLPGVVKAAIKAANKVQFSWENKKDDKPAIQQDQVVLIKNMAEFCESRSISTADCAKFGLAFVMDKAYPIFLNADSANTKSNYDQVQRMYASGSTDIIYFTAGLLVHEDLHAQGDGDELHAYQRELAFAQAVKNDGGVNNAVWFPGYIKNVQANLAVYEKRRNDGLSIKAVAKNE